MKAEAADEDPPNHVASARRRAGSVSASRLAEWMRTHPVRSFIAVTFAWTVTYDLIGGHLLGLTETLAGTLPRDAGPTLAAIILLRLTGGRQSVVELARSLYAWRVPRRWYALTIIGLPAAYLVGIAVVVRPGAPIAPPVSLLAAYPLLIILAAVIGGPLLEEPGWRGFAQPTLQRRFGPLKAAVTIGVVWACWHATGYLDDNFAESNGGRGWPAIALFAATAVVVSIVIAWICNRTNGSVLMAVLAHNSVNVTQAVAGDVWPGLRTETAALAAFALIAAVLVITTRGRLGMPTEASTPLHPLVVTRTCKDTPPDLLPTTRRRTQT